MVLLSKKENLNLELIRNFDPNVDIRHLLKYKTKLSRPTFLFVEFKETSLDEFLLPKYILYIIILAFFIYSLFRGFVFAFMSAISNSLSVLFEISCRFIYLLLVNQSIRREKRIHLLLFSYI